MNTETPRRAPDPRTARTRAAILAATKELLTEQGVEATTIATIAKRAAVGTSSVYVHFASKQELIAELIATALAAQSVPFELAGTVRSPLERIFARGQAYLAFAQAEPAAARALLASGLEPTSPDAPGVTFLDELLLGVEHDLNAAVKAGEISAVSIPAATSLVFALWEGVVDQAVRCDLLAVAPDVASATLQLGHQSLAAGLAAH